MHIKSHNNKGKEEMNNLVWGCQSCNSNMKDKHLIEYISNRWPDKLEDISTKLKDMGKVIE